MEKTEIFPTVTWSAGPGCHGGCGQKLHVKDGKLIKAGLLSKENQTKKIKYKDILVTIELPKNEKIWLNNELNILK